MSKLLCDKAIRTSRHMVCGSKGGSSSYDPNVAAAANQEAATAQQATQFSENYFTNTITPLLQAEEAQAAQTSANENALFQLNYGEAQKQAAEFNQYGLPAETNFYNMVTDFSSPQWAQQEAEAALGDNKAAQAAEARTFNQRLGAAGISSSSPAAIEAMSEMGVSNAAEDAAAMTRARFNAQQLGMQLQESAANYAAGNPAAITGLSGSASGSTQAATAAQATGVNSAIAAPGVVQAGQNLAINAYGDNLNAYSRLGAADISAQAAADSGLGSFFGSVLGAPVSGGGSVLGSLIGLSDRRLKKDLVRVGTLKNGIPVYEFSFKAGGLRQRGVMADDVEKVLPEAVHTNADGYKMVDYGMLARASQ